MPPSEATTNLELILHHLLPLLLLSSLSVKAFVGRWHLLRSKLTHLQASLSQLYSSLASSSSPAASQEQNEEEEIENQNPLLRDHLLPNILSTLETIHSLAEQCRDHPPSGKLLMQSNLDIASSSLSLHLRHLDLLLNSGVLCSSSNAAASNNPTAIVLPQPGPSASRDELAFFVRDLFARLQIGGPDFKKKALESLLQLLRDDDDAESAKNSVVVAAEGDVAYLIHLLDSHGHPLFVREHAVHAISVLASASDSSRKAVFEEGALGPLLRLLETGSAAVKEKAAAAVEAITSDPENAWAVSAYGGIRALIEACRSGSPAVQAHSTGALRNAAAVEDIRRALEEEGAIPVLVDLLDSSGHGGGRSSSGNAAHCLWLMASSGEDFRQAIVQEGGLQRLLQLLQEGPNPETIEHALRAIYALSLSASTARALSSSPSAAGFLPQLAELIRQGGSAGLQHISASLICNLSLADERKRALAGCMGALVKMMESPLQKSAAVGTQEVAARALVLLLSVRSNRKEFVREEKNVLKLVQMLDPRRNVGGMCKSYPVSVAAALTAGGGGGCRKRLVAAGACQHLQVLADMDVTGARKVMQRLAGSRLKNIFFTRAWRE
ncbi:hypothetical protein MRB53_004231 [Persea americana]|uniref:Uncharacterized protein n=1 Tax=Persea americana TaxID=3435 RepID=A0ACC2MAN9_PERAE|nr:hypothetical protein MRB53_004231 [Persea americana]|eukprot:TRINITY_DN5014_c2_g2_i1.p1 TRINITY_DN5014_c2_g2~~TRINITY_DN5014_c2_g2_i1.p1  ORF type:complete len:610 (-),score=116.73 TRINITY_DN5014_c2_g2_i1:649-2478(-)